MSTEICEERMCKCIWNAFPPVFSILRNKTAILVFQLVKSVVNTRNFTRLNSKSILQSNLNNLTSWLSWLFQLDHNAIEAML